MNFTFFWEKISYYLQKGSYLYRNDLFQQELTKNNLFGLKEKRYIEINRGKNDKITWKQLLNRV
ncbi:hypothetical protein BpHYR1_017339 [Brachionus plicatilis]|uniref:Uncharacterized protein n=1 Tax=Brachionus plicatilis TaxID=10195 RepID=A0A3M7QNC1_BRAPC|nr:hypothetical protein BpHYR1_017339 [Brachionus plicatilis]